MGTYGGLQVARAESKPGFLFAEKGVSDEMTRDISGVKRQKALKIDVCFASVCPKSRYLTSRTKALTTKRLLRNGLTFF